MEQMLFELFLEQRQKGQLVRPTARRLFAQDYHKPPNPLVFSLGWFQGDITPSTDQKASRLPEGYQCLAVNRPRLNRWNSQLRDSLERAYITTDVGCFEFAAYFEHWLTPIPFEYLEGKMYGFKGSRDVSGKTDHSGWDKRTSSLMESEPESSQGYISCDNWRLPHTTPKREKAGGSSD